MDELATQDGENQGKRKGKKPTDEAARWERELSAADKEVEKFHGQGSKVVDRYLDERADAASDGDKRVNLYHSNVRTLRALLYGKMPSADVDRRHQDTDDDGARVGAEMLQRLLNSDIERGSDTFASALKNALDDWLMPGLGVMRVRYVVEQEEQVVDAITEPLVDDLGQPVLDEETGEPAVRELAPAYTEQVKTYENVDSDYVYWKDFRWSPCRTFDTMRWAAFASYMTKREVTKRFGKKLAKLVPYSKTGESGSTARASDEDRVPDPRSQAVVWEIWSREDKKVYWFCRGMDVLLDEQDDPYQLEGFWPFARPLASNVTTKKWLPKPDFVVHQDLYRGIDELESRISLLEKALRVAGVYDATCGPIERLIDNKAENILIPVDSWAAFAEKGGLQGAVQWMPLADIVAALDKLRELQAEKMRKLYEATGMSDIIRGAAQQSATATEQAIKARFASVRTQELQDELARFATDHQRIRAELAAKLYDDETIVKRSNIEHSPDAKFIGEGLQAIRDQFASYRIAVKPESVSLTDYAQLKSERVEFTQAFSQLLTSSAPLLQQEPAAAPFILEVLKWTLAGFRGGSAIESVVDQTIAAATQALQQKAQQPPKPDPKQAAAEAKAKADTQRLQLDGQVHRMKVGADIAKIQAGAQAEQQKQQAQAQFNIAESMAQERAAGVRAARELNPRGGEV